MFIYPPLNRARIDQFRKLLRPKALSEKAPKGLPPFFNPKHPKALILQGTQRSCPIPWVYDPKPRDTSTQFASEHPKVLMTIGV